jgi:heavy metal sensor kinase
MPIRFRLTLWFSAVLAVTLVAFAVGARLAMRASLYAAIDADLRDRASTLAAVLRQEQSPEQLAVEIAEHAGDLFQVRDERGVWLHRDPRASQAGVDLAAAPSDGLDPAQGIAVGGVPYRSMVSSVAVGGHTYTFQLVEPLRDVDDALRQFVRAMILAAPLMLLIAAAGGYWISGRALRPVDEITSSARAITAGSLSQRLTAPTTGDELERLSGTLNDMLERLDTSFRQARQFTADASHELRTPVAVMRTTAEVLLRQRRTDDEWRKGVEDIHAELTRTTTLIENLMTLARADAGADSPHCVRLDLRDPVGTAIRQATAIAAIAGTVIEWTADAPVPVDGDRQLLERLFVILLDNAVKYSPAGGRVTVASTRSGSAAIVEVRDRGIGIGADDLPHIFERFYRSDKARARETGGSGLGLAIARWIVDLHKGRITVTSDVGRGSMFRVELPAAR